MKGESTRHTAARRARRMRGAVIDPLEQRQLLSAYYVSASASTNGTGTAASPWNVLGSVTAYTGFHAGDVVNLSGTFSNQTLSLSSADAGITLTTSATSPAKIVESASFSFVAAIYVAAAGVTISNLQMTGPGVTANSNSFYAIQFNNTAATQLNGVTVTNVTESGFVFAGLFINGNGFANVSVTNSNFSNNQVSGIVMEGITGGYSNSNLVISNTITSNNAGYAVNWNATHSGANENADNGGIFISSVNGALIDHCTAFNNCYSSSGAVGIWAYNAIGVNIQYCESADNKTTIAGADGDGFDFDHGVSDSIMQYDYSHGNYGAGFFVCTFGGTADDLGDTIRYCISDDDAQLGGTAISVYGYSMNLVPYPVLGLNVYNNTILAGATNSSCVAITGITPRATGFVTANFLNNLFYSSGGGPLVDCSYFTPNSSNLYFEGNDYFTTGGSTNFLVNWGANAYTAMSLWTTASGEETVNGSPVGLNSDPQLLNETPSDLPSVHITNLETALSSPLRGAGLDLTTYPFAATAPYTNNAPYSLAGTAWNGLGSQDYFGDVITRGGSHDIGAHQASALIFNGNPGGDLFYLSADPSTANTLDFNSFEYSLAGIDSIVINGSTGNENVTFNFANGPLSNSNGVLSTYGITFNGGSATNTLNSIDTGTGNSSGMPIFFSPGSSTSNNINAAAGAITIPSAAIASSATFASINIAAGAKVVVANPVANRSNKTLLVVTQNLSIAGRSGAWTGMLDLGGNDMDLKTGSLATVSNQINQGFNAGWQASGGIISSAAAADTTHLTTLGCMVNNDPVSSLQAIYSTFDSVSASNTDILVKYTYLGDANLDGKVDGSDYSRIDNAILTGLTGWYNGDFNLDGMINASDYTLIDNAYNTQGALLAAQIAAPETQTPSGRVTDSAASPCSMGVSPMIAVLRDFDHYSERKAAEDLAARSLPSEFPSTSWVPHHGRDAHATFKSHRTCHAPRIMIGNYPDCRPTIDTPHSVASLMRRYPHVAWASRP